MKKFIYTLTILLIFILQSFGQINPVNNLTWEQNYVFTHNYFQLNWDEPTLPHSELIGYNIYRENELYRFQTETTLFNFYSEVYGFVSNCSDDFLSIASKTIKKRKEVFNSKITFEVDQKTILSHDKYNIVFSNY